MGAKPLALVCRLSAAASTAGFLLMGSDKARAKKGSWRIPEKTFFGVALLGGTPGCLAGMYLFHHKTRHWYFRWGIPLILLFQICIAGLDYPLVWAALLMGALWF